MLLCHCVFGGKLTVLENSMQGLKIKVLLSSAALETSVFKLKYQYGCVGHSFEDVCVGCFVIERNFSANFRLHDI